MRLIKGSLAGLILAGILAMLPAAAFAHGGEGGGGGGGGRGFGGGHTFGGFTGRGFSPGFMGGEPHFSSASARDFAFHDGRFNNRFFAHDLFFRHHHRFVSNFAFVGVGFPDWDPNYYGSDPHAHSNKYRHTGYADQN